MNIRTKLFLGALWVIADAHTLVLAQSALIRMDGSSTVHPISELAANDFRKANKSAHFTVGISGTGGGFKKFCNNEIDIVNASRPISIQEIKACRTMNVRYIELPIALDAISIIIHPKNSWVTSLSIDELRLIWQPAAQGRIKSWKHVNPNYPDISLKLYGPGIDSGTFDYFTQVINGKTGLSRGDYSPSEDDQDIIQDVASQVNGLGYLGLAYLTKNATKVKGVSISWKNKEPVYPSVLNVTNGSYVPLSRPIMIYVNTNALKKPMMREFLRFYLNNGEQFVQRSGYVGLPAEFYQLGIDRVNKELTGTAFSGISPIGVDVKELMKRKLDQLN